MADEQYQADWSKVGLPDTSSDWTIGKALQQYANPAPVVVAPDNSSLNTVLDKQTMADIDWTGEHDRPNPGAGGDVYTGLQPYAPAPQGSIQDGIDGNGSNPRADAHGKPGWAQLPQPGTLEAGEPGSGYYTYGTDPSGRASTGPNYPWGEPRTMQVIGSVADRLATGNQYTPFGVGNISLADGAPSQDHQGHQDGLGVDVRPARSDGAQLPVTYKNPQYDRAATQRLVDAFRATGQVGAIYFNDPQIRGVQPWKDHDNHFHVQLKR